MSLVVVRACVCGGGDLEPLFYGEGVVSGRHVPILSATSALKTKEIKPLQVLSLSLSLYSLVLYTPRSCLGDCAASLSHTFITATQAGGIIYSSAGCTHYSSLYGRTGVRWWDGVRGQRGGCLKWWWWWWWGVYLTFSIAFS